jgi:sphingomyelin phosphodiesterase acid-like 3
MRSATPAVWLAVALTAALAVDAERTVLHFSDFHYDPFFGTALGFGPCNGTRGGVTPYGVPGCDASLHLVETALRDGAAQTAALPQPPLLLYTGDWLRHEMASLPNATGVAHDIIATLIPLIKNAAGARVIAHPQLPVALGNEDFIPDYHFDVNAPGRNPLLNHWGDAFHAADLLNGTQAAEFKQCGFTSMAVAADAAGDAPLLVVMLNTVLFAKKLMPPSAAADPCGELAWLGGRLAWARANAHRVYTTAHIPPVREHASKSKHGKLEVQMLWHDDIFEAYTALMKSYRDVVAAQFFGHTHHVSFLVTDHKHPAHVAPAFVGGPLTRESLTNPCYGIATAGANWTVAEYRQRYLTPRSFEWSDGRRLRADFRLPDLSAPSLYAFGARLAGPRSANFSAYYQMHMGGWASTAAVAACGATCRRMTGCATIAVSKKWRHECENDGP